MTRNGCDYDRKYNHLAQTVSMPNSGLVGCGEQPIYGLISTPDVDKDVI